MTDNIKTLAKGREKEREKQKDVEREGKGEI